MRTVVFQTRALRLTSIKVSNGGPFILETCYKGAISRPLYMYIIIINHVIMMLFVMAISDFLVPESMLK